MWMSLTFVLGAVIGMIITILPVSKSRTPVSTVSRSTRVTTGMNRSRPVAQFSLLGCLGLGEPGGIPIWSTQIPALRFVCKHEPQGSSCSDLKVVFIRLAQRYPEIYDGYSFHNWGQLLVD